MKARYVIGKKLLGTVPFMKAGSAAICLVATTMEAYVAYIKLQRATSKLKNTPSAFCSRNFHLPLWKEIAQAGRALLECRGHGFKSTFSFFFILG